MNRRQPRQAGGLPKIFLRSAGFIFGLGLAGRLAVGASGQPELTFPLSESTYPDATMPPGQDAAAVALAAEPADGRPPADRQSRARAGETAGQADDGAAGQAPPNADAVPDVAVRVGDHGDFERVAFAWPDAVDHDVERRDGQVVISFGRPGRIDLSGLRDGSGRRVLGATAEGSGDPTRQVVLRVAPNTEVASFSLEGNRVVVIEVSGGAAVPVPAQHAPDSQRDEIETLKRALEQRDVLIADLLARVERLEQQAVLDSGDLDRVTAGQAAGTATRRAPPLRPPSEPAAAVAASSAARAAELPAAPPAAARPQREATVAARNQGGTGGTDVAPAAGTPGPDERQQTAQAPAPAPGQFEVDEEAAERALDFTLVQEGALLLPTGRVEVSPSFTYTRRTGDFPVVLGQPGNQVVAERDVRRNEFDFFGSLLVGLPFDSQIEFGLPYNIVEQSVVDRVRGNEVEESDRTGHGLGDFSVGVAKTVLRERNWLPDVVLRINWDTGTGERNDNDVALDGGFQELTGSISLAKRQDPLVFVGGAFYEAVFENDNIDPGNSYGFNIGTFLAASPNTSLRVVLNQSFIEEFKVGGQSINGSDRVQSVLTFGASAILGRNVLLDGAVGVGLTDDSPDYSVSVSLPIRFSTPGL